MKTDTFEKQVIFFAFLTHPNLGKSWQCWNSFVSHNEGPDL